MPNEAKSAFGTSLSWGGNVIAGIETITLLGYNYEYGYSTPS